MKTPISYYGGKQNLAVPILRLIPEHNLYCEPFIGGAAVFFAKNPSQIEVINDTNRELINFYEVVKNDFAALESKIRITLHSRSQHGDASHIYNRPQMFDRIQRAWAVWCLASQCFSGILDGGWKYDVSKNINTKSIKNKCLSFSEDYAIRLQNVQIECTDAIRIIRSRDSENSFFYCDPPYFNADMGHYDGYTLQDFQNLLDTLATLKGKFLLSSYRCPILSQYVNAQGWHTHEIVQSISASINKPNSRKPKTEVLTANYPLIIE